MALITWISWGDLKELLNVSHAVNDLLTIRSPSTQQSYMLNNALSIDGNGFDWRGEERKVRKIVEGKWMELGRGRNGFGK